MKVEREITLPHPREVVWEAIADPVRLGEWLDGTVEVDVREGSSGTFRAARGDERAVTIVEVVPGERLRFRWWGDLEPETEVELTLDDVPDGTLLTVVESPVVLALARRTAYAPARSAPSGPVALAA